MNSALSPEVNNSPLKQENINNLASLIKNNWLNISIEILIWITAITIAVLALTIIWIKFFAFVDQKSKKQYFLAIDFDKYTNFKDSNYIAQMQSVFSQLRGLIRTQDIFTFEVHKTQSEIKFLVTCSNKHTLDVIERKLKSIEGIYTHQGTDLFNEYQAIENGETVTMKESFGSINFNNKDILEESIKILEGLDANEEGGLVFLFRGTEKSGYFKGRLRQLRRLLDQPKNRNKENHKAEIEKIEDKRKGGEILEVKIQSFGSNKIVSSSLSSLFKALESDTGFVIRPVFWPFLTKKLLVKHLKSRYLGSDTPFFRMRRGYSYLNTLECANLVRPVNINCGANLGKNQVKISIKADILLEFNNLGDNFSIYDGYLNPLIIGAPGSAKTTGSLNVFTRSLISKGFGGLITVYKEEEAENAIRIAAEYGREKDLIVLDKSLKWKFNIFDYERELGTSILNIAEMFDILLELIDNKQKGGMQDAFWVMSNKDLIRNVLYIMAFLDQKISIENMAKYADMATEQNPDWQEKLAEAKTLVKAGKLKETDKKDLESAIYYWENTFMRIPEKQRESLKSVFRSVLFTFMTGSIRDVFCTDTNFTPELTRQGKIVIANFPAEKMTIEARMLQVLLKYQWQQTMKRVKGSPVFYIGDEYQEFVTSADIAFFGVNRGYKVINITATQSLSRLHDAVGRERTESLLSVTQNQIFHRTSDTQTIEHALKLFGQDLKNRESKTFGENYSTQSSQSLDSALRAKHFQQVKNGQGIDDIEAIIYKQGQIWNRNKQNYLTISFNKLPADFSKSIDEILEVQESQNQLVVSEKSDTEGAVEIRKKPADKEEAKLITIKEAALQFPVSEKTIRRWITDNKIKRINAEGKTGKIILVSQNEIQDILKKDIPKTPIVEDGDTELLNKMGLSKI